jgi:hypothetical protein
MPDDKKKVGMADRSRVAAGEIYEVGYAAKKFGKTRAEVKEAIKKVGNTRTGLTKHFNGK